MAHRILIVEDDPSILRGIELNLQLEGYQTLTATDGPAALEALGRGGVDLMVLDIMLPHLSGYQVCKRARAAGHVLPIVLLSAKSMEIDVVMGLDLGADDYVTKPFRVAELLARIKAQLRRHAPTSTVTFGEVEVDRVRQLVKRRGEPVELSAREYALLDLLLERTGRAVTRETILEKVWGDDYFGTDRTVDNFITRLRQKLDTQGDPRFLTTVRGVGYRFEPGESS
ncbi:MAG: response regulator transcription factor [Deltaproteobacteria bacterium]|nr:response regulator transcription factor [Deltaproteobacteria bacterium]